MMTGDTQFDSTLGPRVVPVLTAATFKYPYPPPLASGYTIVIKIKPADPGKDAKA